MHESGGHHPARMTVSPNRLGGLKEMLELREIGVGVAVVDEGVEEFGCFPDALFAALEPEVLALLAQDVSVRLVGVVEAVEFGDSGIGFGIVLAELFLRLAFLVAAFEKLLPF